MEEVVVTEAVVDFEGEGGGGDGLGVWRGKLMLMIPKA